MAPQVYNWTCSICSYAWVIQSTGMDPNLTRERAAEIIGMPNCVNSTYGLMSTKCMLDAFAYYNLEATAKYVTFDEAYAICREHTGTINPNGMYHFMAIRGTDGMDAGDLWVANSAPGYCGVYDTLTRSQFNSLGPVELVYLV